MPQGYAVSHHIDERPKPPSSEEKADFATDALLLRLPKSRVDEQHMLFERPEGSCFVTLLVEVYSAFPDPRDGVLLTA